MRYIITFLLIVYTCIYSDAQLKWGIETGVNISHSLESNKTKAGFNVGLTGEYSLNKLLFFDASLKLSSEYCGNDTEHSFNNSKVSRVITNYKPYYLLLPIRVGFHIPLFEKIETNISLGPIVGIGLFGSSNIKHISYLANLNQAETITSHYKSNNIFNGSSEGCFSNSRFQYGADANISCIIKSHYKVGFEYCIVHLSGNKTAIDNLNIYSFNIGYIF